MRGTTAQTTAPAAAEGAPNVHRDLWDAYWRDPTALDTLERLIAAYLAFARRVLARLMIRLPSHVRGEDLLNSALIGLYEAICRYDPRHRGVSFEAFATRRIRGAVLDELRARDPLSRTQRQLLDKVQTTIRQWQADHGALPEHEEIAEVMGLRPDQLSALLDRGQPWLSLDAPLVAGDNELSLADVLSRADDETPDYRIQRDEQRAQLVRAFRQLTTREQKILYLYYYEDLRLREIAALFDMTEARVCQIHALAVAKLKQVLTALDRPL